MIDDVESRKVIDDDLYGELADKATSLFDQLEAAGETRESTNELLGLFLEKVDERHGPKVLSSEGGVTTSLVKEARKPAVVENFDPLTGKFREVNLETKGKVPSRSLIFHMIAEKISKIHRTDPVEERVLRAKENISTAIGKKFSEMKI